MRPDRAETGSAGRRVPVVMLALALGACAPAMSGLEAISPIGWIKATMDGVTDLLDTEDEGSEAPLPETPYPDLNSVPVRTTPPSTPDERRRLQKQLEEDRSGARQSGLGTPEPDHASAGSGALGPAFAASRRSSLWPNALPLDPDEQPAVRHVRDRVSGPALASAGAANSPGRMPPVRLSPDGASVVLMSRGRTSHAGTAAPEGSADPSVLIAPSPRNLAPIHPVSAAPVSLAAAPPQRVNGAAGVVWFAHGSTRLSDADRTLLSGIARAASRSDSRIRVIGHASARAGSGDPVGLVMANFEMSLQRANAVARVLVGNGVPSGRVTVEAVGAGGATAADEKWNRRAEIHLDAS